MVSFRNHSSLSTSRNAVPPKSESLDSILRNPNISYIAMAMKMAAMLRSAGANMRYTLELRRLSHIMAFPPPLDGVIDRGIASQPFVLPEFHRDRDDDYCRIGLEFPNFIYRGSMELMAVPKRKVSPHKRGIRNGPKALKPIPVIIRCKGCGRVKLPHFYCCSGREQNDATR